MENNLNLEIESQDVIKLVLQFLRESNLHESMKALQRESGITLNTVDHVETFVNDIRHGRWDSVLAQTSALKLPMDKLTDLYEQIVMELLEAGERDLAKKILTTTEPLTILKSQHPIRYEKIETLCRRPYFDENEVYAMGMSKERKRLELAESFMVEVSSVQPSRLLSLLGQALRYQYTQELISPGISLDLFRGSKKAARKDLEDKLVNKSNGDIVLSNGKNAEIIHFGADGSSIITGSSDGCIESWDIATNKLRQDLEYQLKGDFMQQDSSILCVTLSKDGDHIASGSRSGQIRIWKISTGKCLKIFPHAHSQGVTSVSFARDGTQILSTSYDQTARIHGLKSGKILKEFRGHTSFVTCSLYIKDGSSSYYNIITGSSDGTIKLWDMRSTECLLTFRPSAVLGLPSTKELAVLSIQMVPNNYDHLLVCTKSPQAFIATQQGQLIRSFSTSVGGEIQCATISPQGRWLYCVGEDGCLYMYDVKNGQLEDVLPMMDDKSKTEPTAKASSFIITSIAHHPHRNLLAVAMKSGGIKFWRP